MTLYVLLTGRFPFSWPADAAPGDSHATRVQRMFARITTGSYMPLTGVGPQPAPVCMTSCCIPACRRCTSCNGCVLRVRGEVETWNEDLRVGDLGGDFGGDSCRLVETYLQTSGGNQEADGALSLQVSPVCADLIARMLVPQPQHRATAAEVMRHPWFRAG